MSNVAESDETKAGLKPSIQVRFETPFRAGSGLRELRAAIWDGIRLRCPSCSKGEIFGPKDRVNATCSECGVFFERAGEGDFIGAITTAYAFISGFIMLLLLVLNRFTEISLMIQLVIASVSSLVLLLVFYRNMRGFWVALLVAVTKWMK